MPANLITMKVALAFAPEIWRKIAIRDDQTFDDLHHAIFEAFDRFDEHLYTFYHPKKPPRDKKRINRNALRDAQEYSCDETYFDPFFEDKPNVESSGTKLRKLNLQKGEVLYYLFDFGDEWWHIITVESVEEMAKKGKYPCILEKHGASPPQYPDFDEEDDELADESEDEDEQGDER